MNRKRRYLISAAVLAACVGLALGVLAMLPSRPGVTKENFDRIEKGMNLAEVETILGRTGVEWNFALSWSANDGSTGIIWFEDKCVSEKGWIDPTESIPDKLRRWLHLPK